MNDIREVFFRFSDAWDLLFVLNVPRNKSWPFRSRKKSVEIIFKSFDLELKQVEKKEVGD